MGILQNIFRRRAESFRARHSHPPSKQGLPGGRARRLAARSFQAADLGRLSASWTTQSLSADAEVEKSLKIMRARSREQAINNDYCKRFLRLCQVHIAGPDGVALQVTSKNEDGSPDKYANDLIEQAWRRWGKKGVCDVTGRYSMPLVTQLICSIVPRDGEMLIRKVRQKPTQKNPFGFALQLIEADRLDVDYTQELRNGRMVRMGVELDRYERPVAYHILTRHPGDVRGYPSVSKGRVRQRIPADEIIYCGLPTRLHQTRCIPWTHAALRRLYDLGEFEYAALVAARTGASKMGFYEFDLDAPDYKADGVDSDGNLVSKVEAGTIEELPPGVRFNGWDPAYPNNEFDPFTKACLRGISAGLDVSYHTLANDLKGVNYSSGRLGALEDRDNWRLLQGWLCDILTEIFEAWLDSALLAGALDPLPYSKFDKFNAPQWHPRRWAWVNPKDEVEAHEKARNMRITSLSQIIRENGRDRDEVWDEIQAEEQDARARGILLPDPDPATAGDRYAGQQE